MRVRSIAGGVEVLAPAKLNLFLEVLGRRPDGYHEIETVMAAIGLYDTLTFLDDPSGEIRLRCSDPTLPVGGGQPGDQGGRSPPRGDGLPARGADRRWPRRSRLRPAWPAARATPRRPWRPWIGSGTFDLPPERLDALAAEVGSDVPFFNHVPAAVCRGRGERVEAVPLTETYHFVLICPPVGVSTADVYRRSSRPIARGAPGRSWRPWHAADRKSWGGACSTGSNPSPRPSGPNSFGCGTPWRTWARCSTGPR